MGTARNGVVNFLFCRKSKFAEFLAGGLDPANILLGPQPLGVGSCDGLIQQHSSSGDAMEPPAPGAVYLRFLGSEVHLKPL